MKRLAALLGLVAMDAFAGGAITIPAQVPFAPDVKVSDAAKAECDLQAAQSDDLKSSLGAAGYSVTQKDNLTEKTAGRVLLMEFASGQSTGHAMDIFSPRTNFLIINGCLFDDGKVVATFMDSRFSTGGFGGEYKKTCAILHKIQSVMADDVAKWLANPPMFAMLGDAARGGKVDLPPDTPPFCMMSGKLPAGSKEQWMAEHPKK